MKRTLILGSIVLLAACSAEPGSEKWCEAKKEQPKSEWTGSDAATFAKHCVIDGLEVGTLIPAPPVGYAAMMQRSATG